MSYFNYSFIFLFKPVRFQKSDRFENIKSRINEKKTIIPLIQFSQLNSLSQSLLSTTQQYLSHPDPTWHIILRAYHAQQKYHEFQDVLC